MHKPAASFLKSAKVGQKQGIKSNEKLYNVKRAITHTMVPELMKIFQFFSYLSDSKNQTIIDKVCVGK